MSYENIWEEHGVYRKYNGCVSGEDIRNAVEEVEGDKRFDSIRYILNDFLEVTELAVSTHEIAVIAAIDKIASLCNPNIMVAMVAAETAIQEMAALYCDLSKNSPFQTRTFTRLYEAREWAAKVVYLSLPPTKSIPTQLKG